MPALASAAARGERAPGLGPVPEGGSDADLAVVSLTFSRPVCQPMPVTAQQRTLPLSSGVVC